MSKPILEIRGVSKKFRLRHELTPYLSLRERLGQLMRWERHTDKEDFWALKDIDFDVNRGDSIAIIGKNGAGKSTLLKVLSRITPPTEGTITARGRIASLLEVGTGFHPELTGRENIFLNGSILGMRRSEIHSKLDEIISFSGVERFLDTPLKHYSSGMQLRLAFSVAAFLEPEVLIVDEVLAVGDMEFQKKCMGKMDEVSRSGRTILFVSHNLGALKNLCKTGILLRNGVVKSQGNIETVIDDYIKTSLEPDTKPREKIRSACGRFTLKLPYWINSKGETVNQYEFGSNPILRFEFDIHETAPVIQPGMALLNKDGNRIFTSHAVDDTSLRIPRNVNGRLVFDTELDVPELAPGSYQIIFGASDDRGHVLIPPMQSPEVVLSIQETNRHKDGASGILWHTGKWRIVT